MEMHRVWVLGLVDEPNDGLGTPLHLESRTRRHAIVPDEGCWPPIWVDLLLQLPDFDLIVVDGLPGDRVLDSSTHRPSR